MRKSSKLLAVLLTLCLLFGAITAIFVSATETEVAGGDEIATSGTTLTGNSNPATGGGTAYAAARDLAKYDFVTIDLDITPAGDNGEYHPGMLLQPNYILEGTTSHKTIGGIYVVKSGNYYYASAAKNVADVSDATRLSATPGVYDHFTFVLEVTHTGEGDEMVASSVVSHVYVNGKYLTTDGPVEFTTGVNYSRFSLKKPSGTGLFDAGCGVTYNLNVCKYTVGGEKAAALATVVEAGTPLYNSTSSAVLYNANYVAPDAGNHFVKVGENTYTKVGDAMDAIAAMQNNAEITVSGRDFAVSTIPASVKKFTVTLENGGKFELLNEALAKYTETETAENTYTYEVERFTVLEKGDKTYADYGEVGSGTPGESYRVNANGATMGVAENFSKENGTKSEYISASHIKDGKNTYVRIHYTKGALEGEAIGGTNKEREASFAWRAVTGYSADLDISNFKYMTLDFDLAADAYAYTYTLSNGTEVFVTAVSEAEAEAKLAELYEDETFTYVSHKLAFPDSTTNPLTLAPRFMYSTAANNTKAFTFNSAGNDWKQLTTIQTLYVFYYDDAENNELDGWYINTSKTVSGAVKLSNELGVFDHITYAFEISRSGDVYTIITHIYINGEYYKDCGSKTFTTTGGQAVFHQITAGFYSDNRTGANSTQKGQDTTLDNPGDKMYDKYSIAFDNLAVNYYTNAEIDSEKTLYEFEDAVYSADYVTPNPEIYATLNDDFKYYVIGAAFNNLEDCGTIYLHNVGKYELPASLALNEFTLIASEGEYVYSADDEVRYTIVKDGTVYTFKLNRSYVEVNGVEYTLEEALEVLAALKDSKDEVTINLVRTNLVDYKAELANFTVTKDEYSTFTLSADWEAWRYAKVGDASYIRAIDGDVQANVTLFADSFRFNLYIPYNEALAFAGGYSGATWTADKYLYDGGIFTYNGVDYIKIFWNVRHDMWNKAFKAEFTYTVDEVTYTLEDMLYADFNALEYATIVAGNAACGSEEAELMKAMVDYKIAFKTAAKGTYSKTAAEKAFYAKYEAHADYNAETGLCSCSNVTPEADYITVGAAQNSEYKDEVSFAISSDGRNIYLQIDAADINADADYVTVAYRNVENKPSSKSVTVASGVAQIAGISATNIDNVLTVKLYKTTVVGEGEEAETNYELLTEFNYSLADMTVTEANDVALLAALKAYAIAAENYKKYIPAN